MDRMAEQRTGANRSRGGSLGKTAGIALLVAAGFAVVLYAASEVEETKRRAESADGDALANLTDATIEERLAAAGWEIQRDASRDRFLHLHLQRGDARAILIFAEYRNEQIATQQVTANREPGWATRLEGRRLLSVKVLAGPDESERLLDFVTGAAVPPHDAGG
jgi:hypothetical protein